MIRLYKHPYPPASLSGKTSWRGDDVISRLAADQHGKCYLCERFRDTDYHVEHLRNKERYPGLACEWSNLFWSCSYCNEKKHNLFDNLLNPADNDIEDIIYQAIDFPNSKAVFAPVTPPDPAVEDTVALLYRIFNGTKNMRNFKEERFYSYAKSRITSFQKMALDWLRDEDPATERCIIRELDVKAEFLGFKYWIIRSNPGLLAAFGPHTLWNRPG